MIRLTLKLPQEWKQGIEIVPGPFGTEEQHAYASCGNVEIEISEAEMPQDSTAPDQALTNYVDMVGFDDDDPEDFNPIQEWNFNNRHAYGFQVYCEDESQIRVMCLEHHRGRLAVISVQAPSEQEIDDVVSLLEKTLRF
ncbi:MAG: hypothetical protein MJY58_03335 [Bacteroidaceae bacterium]|nr:hypothetical protein [Bacteroidaceae bacterium]